MDPSALAGLCAVLAAGGAATTPLPAGVSCPAAASHSASATSPKRRSLAEALRSPSARQGIARVAFAEAGNQGDSGLAAVVYAILNRLADGRWGSTVDAVLNARGQFEPVMRAGGDWRGLPPVSAANLARIDTILNLAIDGRLPDLTNGARFFQNPAIVAQRAVNGTVSARLVNFGGASPSAVIGAHTFYADAGQPSHGSSRARGPAVASSEAELIVGGGALVAADPSAPAAQAGSDESARSPASGDPSQALFVGTDGVVRDELR